MTVGELSDRMTAREMAEWEILERIEPFGESRADYRMALAASQIVNIHLKPKDRKTAADFLLKFEIDDQETPASRQVRTRPAKDAAQTPDTLKRKFAMLTHRIKPDGPPS